MKRREKELERERERNLEREVYGRREYTGRRGFFESETRGSQTRESRRVDATNARFETAFKSGCEGNADVVVGSASR